MFQKLIEVYDKHYKKLLVIPMLLLLLAIFQIAFQTATTGDFVQRGISLKGGSTITITKDIVTAELEDYLLQQFPGQEISVRSLTQVGVQTAVTIDSGAQTDEEINVLLKAIKQKVPLQKEDYTVEIVGAALGQSFFRQTFIAVIIAFILMSAVVFAYFRNLVPSLAIILATFSDIVATLAIFNLIGTPLSAAGVAAFLMVVGSSVDNNILLTTRLLKRKEGTIIHRLLGAMKTGFTMSIAQLVAVVIAIIFVQSPIIKQIMLIILISLLVDYVFTWIQNVAILRYYIERKQKHHENP